MIQGTTPTITLHLPLLTSDIAEAEYVVADDQNTIILKWRLEDMEATTDTLKIKLTQDDTILLEPRIYQTQLRVKLMSGDVMATQKMPLNIQDLIAEDVI